MGRVMCAFAKDIIAVMVVMVAVLCIKISARADGFDAAYYAAKYPDVVMYQHYMHFGIFEGRFQNAEEERNNTPAGIEKATYVDVDIVNQTMTFYQEGVPILSSDCVTGTENAGNGTPTGVFHVETKIPGKRLVGPDWDVWVDRWMRFNGNIGLHDANWRGKFGGEIYKNHGSHGCVNLPSDVAKSLYDMVEIGTVVIVH